MALIHIKFSVEIKYLFFTQGQVTHRKRFQEEFGPDLTEKEPVNKPGNMILWC